MASISTDALMCSFPGSQSPISSPTCLPQLESIQFVQVASSRFIEHKLHTIMVFPLLVVLAELLGIGVCVMMGTWFGNFQGSYAWREQPKVEFNYHPLFLSIGLLFLYGNGIIIYRVFPKTTKLYVKMGHTAVHLGAIAFAVVGLVAAFDSHNLRDKPIPNLYSLHSWIGIVVVSLFCLQWVLGFSAYLLPGLSVNLKKLYMPHHVFWGVALFGLAAATSLMGIVERSIFQKDRINITILAEESILINCMGVLLAAYAVVVIYIAVKSDYKRPSPDAAATETTPIIKPID
ncbi:hypothetical protein RRG08_006681 [Elysia crispata]|uniref:Cytochrome b561 domain-containing protein n=1 Tax=Elysia crispata TaxID=231223 RepID=A0AAE0YWS8_9GAST|nr:hypothetical protein RRG08_006681 [Elysia crispata]